MAFQFHVHFAPPQSEVRVRRDLIYRDAGSDTLLFDLYCPESDDPAPVVTIVQGEGPPEVVRKDWGQYRSWGALLASNGIAAVAFDRRSAEGFTKIEEAASDVKRMLRYMRQMEDPCLDTTRLGIFAISAGVPLGASLVLKRPNDFQALVCYYGPMSDRGVLRSTPGVSSKVLRSWSPLHLVGASLPKTLVVQAGLDRSELNESIDEFIEKAQARGLPVELISHQSGHHAFDIRDDSPRTREVIAMTLQFLKRVLIQGESK